jgi:hypothetical protein
MWPVLLSGLLLCACDRLDPLAVIDSPDGKPVILDSLAVQSGDRVICVRSNVTQLCSRSTAEIIVSGGGTDADVQPGWADNAHVTVTVVRGRLEKSAPSALNGRVRIEYR